MTDQTESEYGSVAAALEKLAHGDGPADPLGDGARAIRALEAKVTGMDQAIDWLERDRSLADQRATIQADRADKYASMCAYLMPALAEAHERISADRDRLAGEVERLRNHTNMWNGCTCWSYTSQEKAHADNCVLSVHAAEVARLTSELAAAREDEMRLLWTFVDTGIDQIGDIDIHARACEINDGEDEMKDACYLQAIREAIDAARSAASGWTR